MKSFLSILLVLVVCTAYGQSFKKRKRDGGDTFQNSPSTVDPNFAPPEAPRHHSKRRSGKGPTVESQKEFADRMQATVKAKRRAEKELMKPQYTDPMYFGHRRPPKKRPPGKMKYCKVCGIRH